MINRQKMLHKMTCDVLVKTCDQLSAIVARAHVAGDHETVDEAVAVLANLFELRWELYVTGGDVTGATREAIAREHAHTGEADQPAPTQAEQAGGAP